ncbi:Uncharacterised protein [Achromobacter sp. 2789STDY5608615]|nr:Uncharacterised protein [Achromobacter sp. 2789STDY5608615]
MHFCNVLRPPTRFSLWRGAGRAMAPRAAHPGLSLCA